MTVLSPEERKALLLSVGTHRGRRPLSPIEVASVFRKALSGNATVTELGEIAQLSPTLVGRFLRLLTLDDEIQHLIGWQGASEGTISFTSGFEMSRLAERTDHGVLARAVLEHGLSSAETRQVVQLRLRSKRPISDCIVEVVGMRPEIDVRHVFIGTILDEPLKRRLAGLSQAERDTLLKTVLMRDFTNLAVRSGRLGPARFTLVGGAELGHAAHGTLERDLNDILARAP